MSEWLVSLSNGSVSGVSRIPKHSRPAASGTGLQRKRRNGTFSSLVSLNIKRAGGGRLLCFRFRERGSNGCSVAGTEISPLLRFGVLNRLSFKKVSVTLEEQLYCSHFADVEKRRPASQIQHSRISWEASLC